MSLDDAKELWGRAANSLKSAEALLAVSPDDAASRAYYAVFHAASAAFALRDQTFKRHGGVRAAVHREWVKTGLWPVGLGADFDTIWALRDLGDYGGRSHVASQDARATVDAARRLIESIRTRFPELDQP